MVAKNKNDAEYAAEIIMHLSRLAYADGQVCSLTSAQWTALGFFRRANKFSRTLSDFAKYHVTTRGSASQTVKNLVTKELLTRTPSVQDKRSARYDLTEKGRSLCDKDPFKGLVQAITALPENHQVNLAVILKNLLAGIIEDPKKEYLGTCSTCQYLKECSDQNNTAQAY